MLFLFISDVPDNGIPIILVLYLKPCNVTIPISMAKNLATNTKVSIVCCLFDNH